MKTTTTFTVTARTATSMTSTTFLGEGAREAAWELVKSLARSGRYGAVVVERDGERVWAATKGGPNYARLAA